MIHVGSRMVCDKLFIWDCRLFGAEENPLKAILETPKEEASGFSSGEQEWAL